MKKAQIPSNDNKRLNELREYNILDTPADIDLDAITMIASYVCQMPISLVSLIDKDRQWFKSKVGLNATETPRDISFCGHAIHQDEVFIIENSEEDERFKDNPLVTGDPHVVFYAGAPLKTKSGYNIGTLCVIDNKPRKLNPEQINILKALSRQVIQYFELRKTNAEIVRKNTELEDFKNKHSIIMENMDEGVVLQDRDYKIIEFNPAALKILSLSEEQLLGKTSLDPSWKCIKEDESEFPGTEHPAVVCLNTSQPQKDIIMGLETKDDKLKWINITAMPIFNEKTKTEATHAVCTFTDVTEKRIIENRLQLCLSATSIGLWEWDVQKNILIWDDSLYRLYELSKNDFSGAYEAWLNSVHPEDKVRCDEIIKNSIKEKKGINFIFRIVTPLNKIKFIQTKAFLKLDKNKKSLKFYGINLDISKEYEAKIELEKFKFAIDNLAIISFTNLKGDITFSNDNFSKISGYKREELIGENHRMLNSGFHSKEYFVDLWKTISSGHVWHGEVCNKKKCGELYWVDSYIIPFKDSSNKIEEYISIRYDITSRKLSEQKLLYSSKMAALGEMAGGISHEINNPLSIILGKIFFLKEIVNKDNIDIEKIKLDVEKINYAGQRIVKVIRGLRDFCDISDKAEIENASLIQMINDVFVLCEHKFKNLGIKVKINCPENLTLFCRPTDIKQVLFNILNNSYDAIKDFVEKWITINILQMDDLVRIEVIDCGNGISKNIVEKIMDPFFTTKPVGKGTGLGLSISKGLIEGHRGKLFYDQSCLNTTFVIELPII